MADYRRQFYAQLGIQTLEAPRAIEAVLHETEIDLDKVTKICLFFRVPHMHRLLLWKLLLGLLPTCAQAWVTVEAQRRQQLQDLRQAARVLFADPSTPLTWAAVDPAEPPPELTPELMVRMAFVKLGLARKFDETKVRQLNLAHVHAVANMFLNVCDDPADAFQIFSVFIRQQNVLSATNIDQPTTRVLPLLSQFSRSLSSVDASFAAQVQDHRADLDAIVQLWFLGYFSQTLPYFCLERMFDIILAGSHSILVYVAVALVLIQKSRVLQCLQQKGDLHDLFKLSDSALESALNQGIDLWEKSQALPAKSPTT